MFEFIRDEETRATFQNVYNEILKLNLTQKDLTLHNPSIRMIFAKVDDNIRKDLLYNIFFIIQYGMDAYKELYKKYETEILQDYTNALMTIKTKMWHEVRIGYAVYTYDDDDNIVAYYDDNTRKVFIRYFSDKNEQFEIKKISSQSI